MERRTFASRESTTDTKRNIRQLEMLRREWIEYGVCLFVYVIWNSALVGMLTHIANVYDRSQLRLSRSRSRSCSEYVRIHASSCHMRCLRFYASCFSSAPPCCKFSVTLARNAMIPPLLLSAESGYELGLSREPRSVRL